MHDAVQRCLSQMLAKGQTVRPSCAMQCAAVSPKHLEALQNSPLKRHSTLGGPEDTEATWLGPTGPFTSPFLGLSEPLMPAGSFAGDNTSSAGSATHDARLAHSDAGFSSTCWSHMGHDKNTDGSAWDAQFADNRSQLPGESNETQADRLMSAEGQQHHILCCSGVKGSSSLSSTGFGDASGAGTGRQIAQRSGEVLLLLRDATDSAAHSGWSSR